LRNLLPDLRRIENELERIRVLGLFHELQVHKTLGLRDRLTTGEPAPAGVEQRGCKLPFTICAVKSPCPGSSVGPFLGHRNARENGLAQRPQPVMSISHTVGRPLPLQCRRLVRPRGPGVLAPEDPAQPEMCRQQERSIERQPTGRLWFGKPVPSPASGRRLREPPLGRRRFAVEMPRTTAPANGLTS